MALILEKLIGRARRLLDLDDNCVLVPDVEALPPRECELFQRYLYW